ncbi:C6 finger domain-containing protein [Colletotrichum musicola]|uniref:C6 finger domain-containing protein n=1 Tax=Colletotrichum musicola TaxID=2175873 RepID=A0A8H6K7D2_9PEZI|nr:C6 finger domain-containing protein [Colletotrichum musicola]
MHPITRPRHGCLSCKRRKRKCDEKRPECGPCKRRRISCEGYVKTLRWVGDSASQAAESQVVDTETATSPDLQRGRRSSVAARVSGDRPRAPAQQNGSPAFSNEDREIFENFLRSALFKLYNTETQSWIRSIFEQLASKSDALVSVCIALQGYVDDGCDRLSVSSMERFDVALRTFRAELASEQEVIEASTACAGLVICSLCARPFTHYARSMADLCDIETRMRLLESGPSCDLPMLHILECLCVMDLPSYVLGRVSPSMGMWKRFRAAQDGWAGGRLQGVDVGSGLPRSLLDILSSVQEGHQEDFESRLWLWPGEKDEVLHETGASFKVPHTELVMCRLMASLDAIYKHIQLRPPDDKYSLVHNGLVFPVAMASLEVGILKRRPQWKLTLNNFREHLTRRDSFHFTTVLFDILDEAWIENSSSFDADEAARKRGVEVVMF